MLCSRHKCTLVQKRLTGPAVRLMLTAVGVLFAIVRVNMLVHAVCRR